jgi:hypothetical protein
MFAGMGGMGGFRPGGMNADQLRNVIDQRLGPEISGSAFTYIKCHSEGRVTGPL